MPQRRLGAVVTGPDGHPLAIEGPTDLDHVATGDHKRQHPDLRPGRPHEAHARDRPEAGCGVLEEEMLLGGDPLPSHRRHIVEGRGEADRVGDVRRARLELRRGIGIDGLRERHVADHVASPLPGLHRPLRFGRGPHRPNSGGAEDLVPGEDEEIAADAADIDGEVRHGLRPVDKDARAVGLRHAGHRLDRKDRPQAVGGMGEGDELRPRPEQRRVGFEDHVPPVVDRGHADHPPGPLREHLPGNDVGVVLDFAEDDLIAGREARAAGVGDEIDPLGRAADENDLLRARPPEEPLHRGPGPFVGVGRAGGEGVSPAMDVRIVGGVVVGDRLDHLPRLLGRGRIVEPGQRLAVDLLVEDGEIAPHPLDIEGPIPSGAAVEPPRRRADRRGSSLEGRIVPLEARTPIAGGGVEAPDPRHERLEPRVGIGRRPGGRARRQPRRDGKRACAGFRQRRREGRQGRGGGKGAVERPR